MITVTVKNLKSGFGRICFLVIVVIALFWGVPKFYGVLAEGSSEGDDLKELTEPLRVEAVPNPSNLSAWFNYIDVD